MISKEIVWTAAGDEGAQKHPMSLVETKRIGKGSTIGAFAHLLPGSVIGDDVRIHEHTYIGCDVVIGDRVVVECGARLRKGARVEADAVIGPNAVVAGETDVHGKTPSEMPLQVLVKEGATVGANATVLAGVTIGKRAVVGAGAVVTRDIPPNAVVAGNPARITGYVDTPQVGGATESLRLSLRPDEPLPTLRVTQASLRRLPEIADLRGVLSFGEIGAQLPFEPKRYFVVYDVPGPEVRGQHAHKTLHEFLVCLRGSFAVVLDDGQSRDEIVLDSPGVGLHLPPMVWGIQYRYSSDAIALVLASDIYRADDYIRDYDEYINLVRPSNHGMKLSAGRDR